MSPARSCQPESLRIGLAALLLGLPLVLAFSPPARAASGGPDGFGYTWRDSAEPGLAFAWEAPGPAARDILLAGDDVNSGLLPLSFGFPYYGASYSAVGICSNGWLSPVDGASTQFTNTALPAAGGPLGIIAAFWDDLVLTTGIGRVLFEDFGDHATITWERAHDFLDEPAVNTFQVSLYLDGRILVQYLDMLGDRSSCTLGIESPDELYGLTAWFDELAGVPASSYAVEFLPPVPVPNDLDCRSPVVVSCGQRIAADLITGVPNQDAYLCSRNDYSGREHVYSLSLPVPTELRILLEAPPGGADLIVLDGCDPNRCLAAPGDAVRLSAAMGTLIIVVDTPPGQESPYTLRVECNPLATDLDCGSAPTLACHEPILGDLRGSPANQDAYWCVETDYSGAEDVYLLDFAVPTTLRLILEAASGDPDLIVLNGCDPNDCLMPPADRILLTDVLGPLTVVVDSRPGQEGAYRLRVECLPIPPDLDCAGAATLSCPTTVFGDTRAGAANQDIYWCSETEFTGAEEVWLLDLGSPTTVQLDLSALAGDPQLILIDACDPSNCLGGPANSLVLDDSMGTFYVVVDAAAGLGGPYQLDLTCLQDAFTFCGEPVLETERWFERNGSWLVEGWFFHPADTHSYALRVDGAQTYSHDTACPSTFPSTSFGVLPPDGPAFVNWGAPEGEVTMTMSETGYGGCCGLLVDIEVTNTDVVDHSYEFRVYHDTAFGDGNGTCTAGVVDGGPITVMGTQYFDEQELVPLGATTCEGQVMMSSAEDPASVRASFQMLPPNLPVDMEFLDWNDGGAPCTAWTDLVNPGVSVGQCFEDNSLLLIWRFPGASSTLAPGESAQASYRIGWNCAFPCDLVCEDPLLFTGSGFDLGPCNDGIRLQWDAASFPGAGNGVYHVYRSNLSFADALLRPPITPPAGLSLPEYLDSATLANAQHYYVIQAESLDYPDCGDGPVALGSTATLQIGPVLDAADVAGPLGIVGNALRAFGHTDDTVDFQWTLATLPGPGESYLVLRADDEPRGPFLQQVTTPAQAWTDPAAPPRFSPVHVWFYDVRLIDACGNASAD